MTAHALPGSTQVPDLQSSLETEERRERARALEQQLLEYVRQVGRRYYLTQLKMRNP